MNVSENVAVSTSVTPSPNVDEALRFMGTLFTAGGTVHFRAVPEPADGRHPTNHHYELNSFFPGALSDFLAYCEAERRACFFLPGEIPAGKTKAEDVLSLPTVLVDLDKGDTLANLAELEKALGPATAIVESGGTTASGAPKLHVYHALDTAATGTDIDAACKVREALAQRFGGDPAFKQPAQVIRVPGSVYWKTGTPKLVKLRALTGARYSLSAISSALGVASAHALPSPKVPDFFDFNNVVPFPESTVDRVLTAPIRSEGKDGITRFEGAGAAIGHFLRQVRDGRMTEDQAWEATRQWNVATLQPPWPEDRLRTDYERLREIDLKQHGPVVQPVVPLTAPDDWDIESWSIDRFSGPAPVRRWLVDGLIPLGTAGVFAAPGDAGKTMLALRLAYVIGCYPAAANEALGFNDAPRFFGCPVLARGPAVLLTAEDDASEIHRRLEAIDRDGLRARGKQRVFVVPMPSAGGVRAIIAEGPNGPAPTEFWQTFRAKLVSMEPKPALVILDPLSAFAAADVERDNRAGALLMTMLGELATATGAAVMLTHHTVKGSMPGGLREARDAIRGVGSLVNNGRWALTMWEAEEETAYETLKTLGEQARAKAAGVVYLGGLAKGNAPGAKVLRTLVRDPASGILEDVTDTLRAGTMRQSEIDDAAGAALRSKRLAEPDFNFTRSRNALWDAWQPVLTKAGVRVTRAQVDGLFERLLERGLLVETQAKRGGYIVYEPKVE